MSVSRELGREACGVPRRLSPRPLLANGYVVRPSGALLCEESLYESPSLHFLDAEQKFGPPAHRPPGRTYLGDACATLYDSERDLVSFTETTNYILHARHSFAQLL